MVENSSTKTYVKGIGLKRHCLNVCHDDREMFISGIASPFRNLNHSQRKVKCADAMASRSKSLAPYPRSTSYIEYFQCLILRGKPELPEHSFIGSLTRKVKVAVELTDPDGSVIWSDVVGHMEPTSEQSVEAAVEAMAEATEAVITKILVSIESALREGYAQESAP